jgi:hypothetical protein
LRKLRKYASARVTSINAYGRGGPKEGNSTAVRHENATWLAVYIGGFRDKDMDELRRLRLNEDVHLTNLAYLKKELKAAKAKIESEAYRSRTLRESMYLAIQAWDEEYFEHSTTHDLLTVSEVKICDLEKDLHDCSSTLELAENHANDADWKITVLEAKLGDAKWAERVLAFTTLVACAAVVVLAL